MSTLDILKTAFQAMLPSNQRIKIAKHREVNDKMMDYLFIPFGVPFPYLGITIPSNCSKCDGKLLNIVDYPYLFEELGNTYGDLSHGTLGGYSNGDGITTFNLPYIQPGASLIQSGTDATSGIVFKVGLNSASNDADINTLITGEVKHKLTSRESGVPEIDLGHYSLTPSGNDVREGIVNYQSNTPRFIIPARDAELAHNNMPPFIVCNWIIRLY